MRGVKEIEIYGFHYGEDKNIMKALINQGFNSRIVSGGIVITFKKIDLFELAEIKKKFEQEKPEDPAKFGWNQNFSETALCFIRTIQNRNQDKGEIKERFVFLIESNKWIYLKEYYENDSDAVCFTLEETKLEVGDIPSIIREYVEWYRNKERVEMEVMEKPKFLIPNSVKMQLRMALVEEGGSTKNGGSAIIICGIRGQALHPYWLLKKSGLSNGIHAHFSVPQAAVLVRAIQGYDGEKISLIEYSIAQKGNKCWIEKNFCGMDKRMYYQKH